MKRFFKTILILNICICINIPTNAAVSVSDGSAFITKSEADADFNNIENRMATLENSLDAKIDSLVAAYLTRNGIWNGKKQELTAYRGLSNTVTKAHFQSLYQSGVSAIMNNIVDGLTAQHYYLVEKIDKAGLVNVLVNTYGAGIKISTYNHSSFPLSGFYMASGQAFTNHNYYRDGARYSGGVYFNLFLNGSNVYTEKVMTAQFQIEEAGDNVSGIYGASWNIGWNPKTMNAYFFCAKEDVLSWNLQYLAMASEFFDISETSNENIRGTTFSINIDSVTVY